MEIDISQIDLTKFIVSPRTFAGELVYLVIPQNMGCEWDSSNLHLRSSVWSADGQPVSLSFKKFFNWMEKPELTPPPSSLKKCELIEKIDGSTLLVSRYKGQLMARTRGTVDAREMEKKWASENDRIMKEYPALPEDAVADEPKMEPLDGPIRVTSSIHGFQRIRCVESVPAFCGLIISLRYTRSLPPLRNISTCPLACGDTAFALDMLCHGVLVVVPLSVQSILY